MADTRRPARFRRRRRRRAKATRTKSSKPVRLDQPESLSEGWNRYDGRFFTARFGGGLLLDFSTYNQNADSREQMALSPDGKVRDFRVLLAGKLKFAPRVSYTIGYMFDGADDDWHWRRTGLKFDFPELRGGLFVGRDKEGFSTSKIMVGYYGWFNERSAVNDAFIPILADGAKWTGNAFAGHLVYNLGFFMDALSETEGFNKNDRQFATRFVYLPLAGPENPDMLHLAVEYRYGVPNDGDARGTAPSPNRSKRRASRSTPACLPRRTRTCSASRRTTAPGSSRWGASTTSTGSSPTRRAIHSSTGGDAFVAYMITDDTHPYNEKGAFFEGVNADASVRDGLGLGCVGGRAAALVRRLRFEDDRGRHSSRG